MTDSRPPAADGELLSAYLAGELPDADVDVLEHRLVAEPALAAQLDALADALMTLAAVEDATPPEGFFDRLRQRLDAEAARGQPAAAASASDVASLDVARAQRRAPTRWWAAVGTVAAVAVAAAVMTTGALRGMGGGDEAGTAAMGSAEQDAPAAEEEGMDTTAEAPASAGGTAEDSTTMSARPAGPIIADANVRLRNEDAVLRRYASGDEVQGLLGTPIEEARDLAGAFTTVVEQAPAFADGTAPSACLGTVTAEAGAALIPVRVESVRYDGAASLAYVLVTATPDADTLDRVEMWVVTAANCATQVFVQQ